MLYFNHNANIEETSAILGQRLNHFLNYWKILYIPGGGKGKAWSSPLIFDPTISPPLFKRSSNILSSGFSK
jgi:hypothetical protein